jgi:hypothetical protein
VAVLAVPVRGLGVAVGGGRKGKKMGEMMKKISEKFGGFRKIS